MANVNLGIQVLWTGDNVEANLAGVESRLDQITEAARRMSIQIDRMGDNAQRTSRRMNDDFTSVRRGLSMLIRDFRTLGLFFVGTIGGRVLGGLVELDGKYRRLLQGLTLTEGTAKGARDRILELAGAATDLGANIENTADMYAKFAINGIENSDKLSLALNGMAASLGIGKEQAERTGVAISQMFAKGVFVRAEEFNQQLADNMPQAIAAAAQGFKKLGVESLDTTQKISSAVQAGTLKVKDFANAIVVGSEQLINKSAAVLNAKVQIENFVGALGIAAGASSEFSVIGGAIGITFNAATKAILEYLGIQEEMTNSDKAQKIRDIVNEILKIVGGFEAATRALADFGKLAIATFGYIFESARATGASIANLGAAIGRGVGEMMDPMNEQLKVKNAAIAKAQDEFLRGVGKNIADHAGQFGESFNRIFSGESFQTPMTDALRTQIAGMDIDKIVEEASKSSGLKLGTGGAADAAGDAKIKRLKDRLTELMETLAGVEQRADAASRQGLSPLEEAVERAQDPMRQLNLRLQDLFTDFDKLSKEGVDVTGAMERIMIATDMMNVAMDEAAIKARKLFEIQTQLANLDTQKAVQGINQQTEDMMLRTDVRFEGEGPGRMREIEREMNRERVNNAMEMQRLELTLAQQLIEKRTEEATNTQLLLEAHQAYSDVLIQTTPAMILQAERMKALVEGIRTSVESSLTDMFTGLVKQGTDFDWDQWASGLIDNITSAIASNWAKNLTDGIMDLFGLGSAQQVKTMNVTTLNVAGTGAGGVAGAAAGLFGGGGGGLGGIMDMAMQAGQFLGFFSKGGVFNGNITPFANGGIMGGPTLFGMGGEKGKEAIMPLQRVGGKLGVAASGGGDTYNISLKAMDTQTGAEFLMRNMETIAGGLSAQRNLGNF